MTPMSITEVPENTTTQSTPTLQAWAGHYQVAGSDKIWAIALKVSATDSCIKKCWGRRGAAPQIGEKSYPTAAAARKDYEKQVTKQAVEGYKPVPFNDPATGIPFLFAEQAQGEVAISVTVTAAPVATVYVSAHVLPLDAAALEIAIESRAHGLSEKVNGQRCLIGSDGQTLSAYNRKGQRVPVVPAACAPLEGLGHAFVLDGERMDGAGTGSYVIFDVLEWQGQDVRSYPYHKRLALIEAAFQTLGLAQQCAPQIAELQPQTLYLLTCVVDPAQSRMLADQVLQRGGEGLIVRTLEGPYEEGDTRHIQKVKYIADLDAFVLRVNPGRATGSVTLGLVRPDDSVIEVCNVRSGLTDPDIEALAAQLARGEHPVLTVSYLPARSVTHKLVEPKTSFRCLRTDKTWRECTTDQLGAGKSESIALAPAVRDWTPVS